MGNIQINSFLPVELRRLQRTHQLPAVHRRIYYFRMRTVIGKHFWEFGSAGRERIITIRVLHEGVKPSSSCGVQRNRNVVARDLQEQLSHARIAISFRSFRTFTFMAFRRPRRRPTPWLVIDGACAAAYTGCHCGMSTGAETGGR